MSQQLESALPLATHLNENLSEVEAWLEEMEAELKAQGQPGENLEEVKKQHDNLKVRAHFRLFRGFCFISRWHFVARKDPYRSALPQESVQSCPRNITDDLGVLNFGHFEFLLLFLFGDQFRDGLDRFYSSALKSMSDIWLS